MSKLADSSCVLLKLGTVEYQEAWALQRVLASARRGSRIPDILMLVEHPPTFTIGRSGTREDVFLNDMMLQELGIALHFVDRGGQITYHGPGQLVGYPILDLKKRSLDVLTYLRSLELVLIDTLERIGIYSKRVPGYTGVWVGEEKIASIGVKVAQGVTTHGFALNVNTDLSYFDHIVPCGITDKGVTSVEVILGKNIDMETVASLLVSSFEQVFELSTSPTDLTTILADAV